MQNALDVDLPRLAILVRDVELSQIMHRSCGGNQLEARNTPVGGRKVQQVGVQEPGDHRQADQRERRAGARMVKGRMDGHSWLALHSEGLALPSGSDDQVRARGREALEKPGSRRSANTPIPLVPQVAAAESDGDARSGFTTSSRWHR